MPEHTIAENLTRLVNAKTAIGNAITAKGGTVGANDGLEEFATDIGTIPTRSNLQPVTSGATIYDFDGSVIATYTPEEFAALTEYPAHPTHEYLTADGYNWTLANAKAYSAKYGYVEVGAQYRVTDGKTRLFITLGDGRLEPQLGLGINGSVDVDWGDGSAHDTMTGSAVGTTVYQVHRYARAGEYIITLTVTGSAQFNGGNGYGLIINAPHGTANANRVYLNTMQIVFIGDNITNIGGSAFNSCTSLRSIVLPKNIISVGTSGLQTCVSLQVVIIPEGATSIGGSAFNSCTSLRSIVLPNDMTALNGSMLYNCASIQSIVIPDSVTSIGGNVFTFYTLAFVVIPDSVTSIGGNAFQNCYGLGYIKFTGTTTIPTIANVNAWTGIPTDCYILVPYGYLDDYLSTTNMPDDSTYLYLCYATYADGATLPTVDGDGYTLTWYATREDARAETNPISVGNGKEIYARGVEP